MAKSRRWLERIAKEAAGTEVDLPWRRGARRTAFIEARAQAGATTGRAKHRA